jgi:hypothetical protein
MKAIFEVEFDPDIMVDQETLDEDFGGDWLTFMQWLYAEEGLGIFSEELRLVGVRGGITYG